jgi:hypothetical protein
MATLKDRLSIDWLKQAAADTSAPRSAGTDLSVQQTLAAAVKGALASQADRKAKVADLARSLEVKFSTLLPVIEGLEKEGILSFEREDPDGGNHVVKLQRTAF